LSNTVPYLGESLALLTALVWALAVILFKKSGEKMHPLALNLFKNILAFMLLVPTIFIAGENLFHDAPAGDYIFLLISGFMGIGIGDTLFFKSLNLVGAGLSSIIACMYSPFIIILSVVFLGESLALLQIVGIAMILSAVLTATGSNGTRPLTRRDLWLGILYGALANASTAVGVVLIKPILTRSPLLWATEARLFSGMMTVALVLWLHPARKKIAQPIMNGRQWLYTFSGSLAGAYLSMIIWLAGMKLTQASIAAALNQTSNIYVFIFAALFLQEKVNVRRIIGILLGVGGTLLVTFG